jgi:hypothetical protein
LVKGFKGIVPSTYTNVEASKFSKGKPAGAAYRWTITAASGLDPEQGSFSDACAVVVHADKENEAIAEAYAVVKRNWYRVSQVVMIEA